MQSLPAGNPQDAMQKTEAGHLVDSSSRKQRHGCKVTGIGHHAPPPLCLTQAYPWHGICHPGYSTREAKAKLSTAPNTLVSAPETSFPYLLETDTKQSISECQVTLNDKTQH